MLDYSDDAEIADRLQETLRTNPTFRASVDHVRDQYRHDRDGHPEVRLREMPASVRVRALELAVVMLAERNAELERRIAENDFTTGAQRASNTFFRE